MSNHHNRWRTGPENNVVACFLATHVNELDRLDSLRNALRSIKGQTTPAQLFVSWSAADEKKIAKAADNKRPALTEAETHQEETAPPPKKPKMKASSATARRLVSYTPVSASRCSRW